MSRFSDSNPGIIPETRGNRVAVANYFLIDHGLSETSTMQSSLVRRLAEKVINHAALKRDFLKFKSPVSKTRQRCKSPKTFDFRYPVYVSYFLFIDGQLSAGGTVRALSPPTFNLFSFANR